MKTIPPKRPRKNEREQAVLFGLIDLYQKSGKPIGSNTLKENGFDYLSSATIRNYFMNLEESGLLKQQHLSGGRVPTDKAWRLFAGSHLDRGTVDQREAELLSEVLGRETHQIAAYLHAAAESLSELTKTAVFLSAPRFDQDRLQEVKLLSLKDERVLCVLLTDFGGVRTDVLTAPRRLSEESLQRIESYFLWRLGREGSKPFLDEEGELKIAQRFYNEIMLRHVVGYANFVEEDLYRAGLSKLLAYPEFNDSAIFGSSLALFEDETSVRRFLREASLLGQLKYWMADEISPHCAECALITMPYRIGQTIVGAVGLLSPIRANYPALFGTVRLFAEMLSEALSANVQKFQITFRKPATYILPVQGSNLLPYKETE